MCHASGIQFGRTVGQPGVHEAVLSGGRRQFQTLTPGRTHVNIITTQKREQPRQPDELYAIIEVCSPSPC